MQVIRPARQKPIEYSISVASSYWVITHNLGYKPNVQVYNSLDELIIVAVKHLSVNQLAITFNSANTGKVRLT
jgi:hypothetical protein